MSEGNQRETILDKARKRMKERGYVLENGVWRGKGVSNVDDDTLVVLLTLHGADAIDDAVAMLPSVSAVDRLAEIAEEDR